MSTKQQKIWARECSTHQRAENEEVVIGTKDLLIEI